MLAIFLLCFAGCAVKRPPDPVFADQVIVRKGDRTLQLLNNGRVFREYPINLGKSPRGHKIQEGDKRTPEGEYLLDWRNPNSRFYKSIHISYPNAADRDFARAIGVKPGGMIMIHGRPNRLQPGFVEKDYDDLDWTDGCIAVKNNAMDEIWYKVRDGTPITILP
ncbi:L,D-transpeptidase family protein [Thiorhodovibrio winogradskyi]|uniref:L,D-transpeptidase family protein n=1 Tax=Thiorhodovibrio winogradskyi TaxID=77007 RepID=UPI002E27AFCC|nr:L,D-transpeptidase family protein [Thiorhodovibrio winogradskyi]